MRTQIEGSAEPPVNWPAMVPAVEQHIDVTVATPLTPDQSRRLKQALASIEGVVDVQTPAAAAVPDVPGDMRAFADRLWETL